jgi:hypothetical protein
MEILDREIFDMEIFLWDAESPYPSQVLHGASATKLSESLCL